ncbi:MAG: hypothetical protein K2J30_05325, partial [Clostridia bacterium]|nr:hypothetical protein [Clostridia bacterium]
IYATDVRPANGGYYQFVPVKLWDVRASDAEYKRVNRVFNELYEGGLNDRNMFKGGLYEDLTNAQIAEYQAAGEKIYTVTTTSGGASVLKRDVVAAIEADPTLKASFNSLRSREKILHFADGYPYFVAYKQNVATKDMTKEERKGWGIYHEMIDENGSYAYVVDLSEGKKHAKYDELYGTALSAMTDHGEYITSQTSVRFTKMISGESPMSDFSEFVKVYNNNGGELIEKQVNAWYKAIHAFD